MNTMTEAKKLWCPMVRVGVTPASGGPAAVNDPTSIAEFSGWCIGDKCAMWRWSEEAEEDPDPEAWWPEEDMPTVEPPRLPEVPATAVWVPLTGEGDDLNGGYWRTSPEEIHARHLELLAQRRGFCGLAGRPEVMP